VIEAVMAVPRQSAERVVLGNTPADSCSAGHYLLGKIDVTAGFGHEPRRQERKLFRRH
jgi:hypothetical protein